MVGGTLVAVVTCKNDPGFLHNGPLAGPVAICAGLASPTARNGKAAPGIYKSGQAYLRVCIVSCCFVQL